MAAGCVINGKIDFEKLEQAAANNEYAKRILDFYSGRTEKRVMNWRDLIAVFSGREQNIIVIRGVSFRLPVLRALSGDVLEQGALYVIHAVGGAA